jgi:hypothetical protein
LKKSTSSPSLADYFQLVPLSLSDTSTSVDPKNDPLNSSLKRSSSLNTINSEFSEIHSLSTDPNQISVKENNTTNLIAIPKVTSSPEFEERYRAEVLQTLGTPPQSEQSTLPPSSWTD